MRDLAVAALARREHSRFELHQKLVAKGMEPSSVEKTLDALEREGALDDQRFAEAYSQARVDRGYGPRRITNELRQRGVSDALIGREVESDAYDWAELASAVRYKKFKNKPDSFDELARQARFMEYRGFSHEHIRYALDQSVDDENL